MRKDKMSTIRDFIVRNAKFVFPVIVIAVVAVTVSVALNARQASAGEESSGSGDVSTPGQESGEEVQDGVQAMQQIPEAPEEVPLLPNEDEAIHSVIASYYDAMLTGDRAVLTGMYDSITENELLRYEENAKYLDHFTELDVYTKAGLAEGATLVYVYYKVCFVNHEQAVPAWQTFYVCDNGQGGLYIKNQNSFSEEERNYIKKVSAQDDVVEFNNRISVEYNELMEAHPELLAYMDEFSRQVNVAIGEALAQQNLENETQEPEEGGEAPAEDTPPQEGSTVTAGPRYATATTTVNVRTSDSEQADKMGKVTGGTRVEVQEVGVNGWTKIVYEGQDGFIKTEFLQMEESAAGQQVIGTVTATTTINVRAGAGEDAERLGVLAEGESLELLAVEGEWCKVAYNGAVAYVKAEFVTQS